MLDLMCLVRAGFVVWQLVDIVGILVVWGIFVCKLTFIVPLDCRLLVCF